MRIWLIPALVALVACATPSAFAESKIDYTRDVRPILADNCLRCHGNDPTHREAELRLDEFAAGEDFRGAEEVIVPCDPDGSELLDRITTDDADMHMPPPSTGKELKPEQIETLRRWIAEGAEYQKHWSFGAPKRPEVPANVASGAVHNPIDAFVQRRLGEAGLKPSPPSDRARLLRRLSLDLIGLPPTPEEVAEFIADDREDAVNSAIERLIASPHFGERWARPWLDAARYADSDGFEKDKPRTVWMYRDWVVKAFNEDMPYDQFLIEQIAGDLLPHPTQDQLVATGFLRNSMINEEGGVDPEQFRMEAMFDRMDAIGKAMLGLTVQCAQCHTHKFDPITQTDYYRMFAFVNNCDEGQVTTYADQELAEWRATEQVIQTIEDQIKAENPDWFQRMAAWEASVRDDQPTWTVVRPEVDMSGDQKHYVLEDGSVLAQGYAPTIHDTDFNVEVDSRKITAFRLELLNDQNLPSGGPGRSIFGTFALTEFTATAGAADGSGERTELKFKEATADVNPPQRDLEKAFDDLSERKRVTGPIGYANDGDDLTAWTIEIGPGRSNVPRNAVFVLEKPLESAGKLRINFKLYQSHGGWNSDDNQNNNLGRFRFSVTDADGAKADPVPTDVRAIFAVPAGERTAEQNNRLFSFWRTTVADFAEQNRRIDALWLSHPRGATQLVLLERQHRRPTHRLDRGNFLAPAEEVAPGVPGFLHPLQTEEGVPPRLAFARWLADRRSPTTARSIVNRLWLAYFGVGLTSTAEDLGTQGELPANQELLDWLACELMDHGWSLKHIHRLITSSATYQQSSVVTPELLAADPDNRLLARGPRFRVDAEVVRDIALSASGLLIQTLGGPGVYPPAPEFLFVPPTSYGPKPWHFDLGRDKYRRSLYTVRYRSIPYPALQVFDAPTGDFACVRRVRSNTPLQALTTLNEPLMIECARALAIETVKDSGPSDRARLDFAFNRCLSRSPRDSEWTLLEEFLAKQRARFNGEGADPWSVLADDKAPKPELPSGVSAPDMAAWTATARVILNLDETITKE